MVRTVWKPSGLDDVRVEPAPVSDPLEGLFSASKTWILVKDAQTLEHLDRAVGPEPRWLPDIIAVVCVEVVRERPSLTTWLTSVGRVLYVTQKDVVHLDGTVKIPSKERYHLADRSRELLANLFGAKASGDL